MNFSKIDFLCSNQDIKVGSYRIWIHDSAEIMKNLGFDVEIHRTFETLRKDSVVILSKGDSHQRAYLPDDRTVGAINISADSKVNLDFVIVGSIEEKKSIEKFCDNVFIVNLIEKMYEDSSLKIHQSKENITIGYHGSYTHLYKLKYGFVEAFNDIIKTGKKLNLVTLTNDPGLSGKILSDIGLNKEDFKNILWSFSTAKEVIQSFDIGIVPNCSDLMFEIENLKNTTSVDRGLYNTDFAIRFKNKSNAGRSFVFNQLGIPVISDLTPSNMPMYHDELCGLVAICKKSWKNSIEKLSDENLRNVISNEAYKRYREIYSMERDIANLVREITNLKIEKDGKNE